MDVIAGGWYRDKSASRPGMRSDNAWLAFDTTETAILEKPAEEAGDHGHGHGH